MAERGEIRDRTIAKQVRDYRGLRWGNVTPTDIDGFVEFRGEMFLFFELKHGDNDMPCGQKIAFERLVDVVSVSKPAILIVGKHENEAQTDIKAHECEVVKYRSNNQWHYPTRKVTMKALADRFISDHQKGTMVGK